MAEFGGVDQAKEYCRDVRGTRWLEDLVTDLRYGQALWASGEFFDVYGVPAMLGRTFTVANDQRGGGADSTVAVISYAFWQRHFGGAADGRRPHAHVEPRAVHGQWRDAA